MGSEMCIRDRARGWSQCSYSVLFSNILHLHQGFCDLPSHTNQYGWRNFNVGTRRRTSACRFELWNLQRNVLGYTNGYCLCINVYSLGQQFSRFGLVQHHLHRQRCRTFHHVHTLLVESCNGNCHDICNRHKQRWKHRFVQRFTITPFRPLTLQYVRSLWNTNCCEFRSKLHDNGYQHGWFGYRYLLAHGASLWWIIDHLADEPRGKRQQCACQHHHVVYAHGEQLRLDFRC